jgi:polysaccharide pyruvyl transferase WcaK-like protein
VIAMRLHAGILAATVGIPPLMVSYDPKVTAFAKLLDVGSAMSMEGLTAARLFEAHQESLRNRERNVKILERKREELVRLAEGNLELLRETLGSPATL